MIHIFDVFVSFQKDAELSNIVSYEASVKIKRKKLLSQRQKKLKNLVVVVAAVIAAIQTHLMQRKRASQKPNLLQKRKMMIAHRLQIRILIAAVLQILTQTMKMKIRRWTRRNQNHPKSVRRKMK